MPSPQEREQCQHGVRFGTPATCPGCARTRADEDARTEDIRQRLADTQKLLEEKCSPTL